MDDQVCGQIFNVIRYIDVNTCECTDLKLSNFKEKNFSLSASRNGKTYEMEVNAKFREGWKLWPATIANIGRNWR